MSSSRRVGDRAIGPAGRILFGAYVAAIGLPIFLLPAYWRTNLTFIFDPQAPASLDGQALRIHWVVPVAGLVAVYLGWQLVRGRDVLRVPRGNALLALGCAFCLALIAGLASGGGILNLVYFAQTTIPVVGFFVGAHAASRVSDLRKLLGLLVLATTLSALGILVLGLHYGAYSQDIVASNRLARAIPQFRDYFPFVVVTALALSWVNLLESTEWRRRVLSGCAAMVQLFTFALVWSRMAILMLLIVVVAPLILQARLGSTWRRIRHQVALTVAAVGILAVLVSQFGIIELRLQRGDFEQSNENRLGYALKAIDTIADNPWFGRGFAADWERDPRPERELRIPRVFKAHNQYLDYGIRAGVPAIALLGVLMALIAIDLRRILGTTREESPTRSMGIAITCALTALFVGNSTQLFLVQAQTGSLAWFLAGAAARLADDARRDETPSAKNAAAGAGPAPS